MLARTLPRWSRSTLSVFNSPSCTGWTKPIASSTSSASRSNSLPAIGLNLSSTCTQCSFATLPSPPENFCVSTANSRRAPSAWLDEVRIFSGQFGQVTPLFSCSGGAGMISSCVTERLLGDAAILLRQEIHREVNARQFAAGDWQVARRFSAAGQRQRVIAGEQFAWIERVLAIRPAADMDAVMEGDALGFHLRHPAVDDMLLHLEIGDAVTQQAAGLGEFLKQMHVVAGAGELLGAGQTGRAGADHGDLPAGLVGSDLRLEPAIVPGAVDDGAFDGLDGDGIVVDVERAGRFARRRTNPPGEFREVIGRMQIARGFFPVAGVYQIVEIRNLVVDRATRRARRHRAGAVAIGNAAIHAARGLVAGVLLAERNDELAKIADALGDRRIFAIVPVDLQKTCNL